MRTGMFNFQLMFFVFIGASLTSAMSLADGKTLYEKKCSKCHGMSGAGDGRAGRNLNPLPTQFNDKAIMSKLTDDGMFAATKYGGGNKSQPLTSIVTGKPLSSDMDKVSGASDEDIRAIVQYIRTFSK